MKNLKLITILLLLASMVLSVVACTTAEESKAESAGEVSSQTSTDESQEVSVDVSETVSEDESMTESNDESEASEDVSVAESEDESEISADEVSIFIPDMGEYVPQVNRPTENTNEKVFKIESQVADKDGNRPIISVNRYKGNKKLYLVMISTPGEVLANAFYDEYGLTFREAAQKYFDAIDDIEERNLYVELYGEEWEYKWVYEDLLPLIPPYKEKTINDFIATYNISKEDIFLNDQLVYNCASMASSSDLGLLMYLDEDEAEEICKEYKKYTVTEFGENDNYGIHRNRDGTYFIEMWYSIPG